MQTVVSPVFVCAQLDAIKDAITELAALVEARHQRARRCLQATAADELAVVFEEHTAAAANESAVVDRAALQGHRRYTTLREVARLVPDSGWRAYYEARVSLPAPPGLWATSADGVCGKVRTLTDAVDNLIEWAAKTDRHFYEQHARAAQATQFAAAMAAVAANAHAVTRAP